MSERHSRQSLSTSVTPMAAASCRGVARMRCALPVAFIPPEVRIARRRMGSFNEEIRIARRKVGIVARGD